MCCGGRGGRKCGGAGRSTTPILREGVGPGLGHVPPGSGEGGEAAAVDWGQGPHPLGLGQAAATLGGDGGDNYSKICSMQQIKPSCGIFSLYYL